MRYHVAYFQCCSYAAMVCVVAVDAPSKAEAAEHYVSLARELDPTLAVQPAYGRESVEEVHEPGEGAGDCPLCIKPAANMADSPEKRALLLHPLPSNRGEET